MIEQNQLDVRMKDLERARAQFVPEKYVIKLINRAEDIVSEKKTLLAITLTPGIVSHLMRLIINGIDEDRKFKRTECLRLLARLIQTNKHAVAFSKEQLSHLFKLYQHAMFVGNESLKSLFTEAVKGLPFDQEVVDWLISHAEESEHYEALILSYPAINRHITAWAERVWSSGEEEDRTAQIAGILLSDEVHTEVFNPEELTNDMLMQAIYFSKLTKRRKRELIVKYMDYDNYATALEVASKLEIGKVSKLLLKHYKTQLPAITDELDEEDDNDQLDSDED